MIGYYHVLICFVFFSLMFSILYIIIIFCLLIRLYFHHFKKKTTNRILFPFPQVNKIKYSKLLSKKNKIMSLGYTRDSLADLQRYYQTSIEEEENFLTTAPAVTTSSQQQRKGNDHVVIVGQEEEDDDDDFLFFDEGDNNHYDDNDDDQPEGHLEQVVHLLPTEEQQQQHQLEQEHQQEQPQQLEQAKQITTPVTPTRLMSRSPTTIATGVITSSSSTSTSNPPSYYSGFDYASYANEYNYSYSDPYAPTNSNKNKNNDILLATKKDEDGLFCCLFPHVGNKNKKYEDDDDESSRSHNVTMTDKGVDETKRSNDPTVSSHDEEESSIDVSHHGIHDDDDISLSAKSASMDEKDQNITSSSSSKPISSPSKMTIQPHADNQGESDDDEDEHKEESSSLPTSPIQLTPSQLLLQQPAKSILKRSIVKPDIEQTKNRASISSIKNSQDHKRRSILPSYDMKASGDDLDNSETNKSLERKHNKRVSFSPMARVVNVMARSEMSFFHRSLIWWQRTDYDDFKKTGRIIAKAMVCGGSEIWLQTSDAWGKKQVQSSTKNTSDSGNNQDAHLKAIQKFGVVTESMTEEKDEDVGSKWWCKFGHSRRGLEHIVSVEEGRQRQQFVNIAVKAVLDEQRRQRISRKDPNKIASVSMQYTSWARDLALAAGAADADAVQSNFQANSKCRIYHLKRNLTIKRPTMDSLNKAPTPSASFVLSANSALTAKVLDAHTHSNLQMKQLKIGGQEEEKRNTTDDDAIAKKAAGFQFQAPLPSEAQVAV